MIATLIESGSTYRDSIFKDLKRAEDIVDTVFSGCTFEGVRWREITLRSCRFVACTFVDCDLSLVDVDGSTLRDVSFDACALTGVNWARAADTMHDPFGVDFRGCVLSFGGFRACRLARRRIDHCVAHECDFRDADLVEAVCRGTDFTASTFIGADLTGADFRRARKYTIDVKHTVVTRAHFSLPDAMTLLDGLDIDIETVPASEAGPSS